MLNVDDDVALPWGVLKPTVDTWHAVSSHSEDDCDDDDDDDDDDDGDGGDDDGGKRLMPLK